MIFFLFMFLWVFFVIILFFLIIRMWFVIFSVKLSICLEIIIDKFFLLCIWRRVLAIFLMMEGWIFLVGLFSSSNLGLLVKVWVMVSCCCCLSDRLLLWRDFIFSNIGNMLYRFCGIFFCLVEVNLVLMFFFIVMVEKIILFWGIKFILLVICWWFFIELMLMLFSLMLLLEGRILIRDFISVVLFILLWFIMVMILLGLILKFRLWMILFCL